jgi:hypothetical protein
MYIYYQNIGSVKSVSKSGLFGPEKQESGIMSKSPLITMQTAFVTRAGTSLEGSPD